MSICKEALSVAAILVASAPSIYAQSTADVARDATPATVTIVTLDAFDDTLGLGSGFVVRSDGVILTNYHVMRGASAASIRLPSGAEFTKVRALAVDPERDLAILKVSGAGMRALEVSSSAPAVGDKLVVIGAPRGLEFTVSEGIVSAIRRAEDAEWIQMSAPISPGSSGGPVLNADGEVVGVTTAYREDGQALNFAVPIRYASSLLARAETPVSLADAFAGHRKRDQGTSPFTGKVTNLGSITERAEPVTGRLALTMGDEPGDSVFLSVGAPLGGSGSARVFCWSDSLMMLSISALGDTIAWLGGMKPQIVQGEYVIVGGDAAAQGGTWWLALGESGSDELTQACRGRPTEKATAGAVKLTRTFRLRDEGLEGPAMLASAADRSQPTPRERAEIMAARGRLAREVAEAIQAIGLMPKIVAHLEANGIRNSAAAQAEGQRLGIDGVFRLEPEEHYNRLRMWGELLSDLDEETCNRWAELDASQRGMYLIAQMDDEQLSRHAAWQVQAAQAELEAKRPALRLSPDALAGSIERIAKNLGDDEGRRLSVSLLAYDSVSPAERCWVERAIIKGALAERGKRKYQLATAYWMLATMQQADSEAGE